MKGKVFLILILVFMASIAGIPRLFSETPKHCSGKIISIYEGGVKDAVFKLQNVQTTFYINRGFEKLKSDELNSLIGKTAVFYYSDIWTPLDPFFKRSKSIEKIEVNSSVLFTF